ncbi:MAG TPA: hypothetical protein VHG91_04405 [Longimicrobium sp.]|nr:hypothetical protein [Longimicrobium sp.]
MRKRSPFRIASSRISTSPTARSRCAAIQSSSANTTSLPPVSPA